MVYRIDPRANYGEFEFNVEWFYQYLNDRNEELIVCEVDIYGKDIPTQTIERRQELLDEAIERAVWNYIVYKVFGFERSQAIVKMSDYDSVYELMYDTALNFIKEHPTHYQLRNLDDDKDDGNP